MKNLISSTYSLLRRSLTVVLAAALIFVSAYSSAAYALPPVSPIALSASDSSQMQTDKSLGERMRERIRETDRNSERPKTTGEFEQEARDGVPLDERVQNIIRDSGEAFNQFGQEYSVGAQESVRSLKEKAAEVIK
ncbi:MAG: hypothetical protein KME15_11915 [Drouetiella hepatica Uher 2000/2452]|jgi:nucleotide-binding universal stress UspA family protein|uniref:Uncharacterized protein n=1 Tax=Drouetiella hepatica Uher 2000/2452 TaxID=904376 RepID=A0A951QDJ0_9CYAN|nr:hypothetical protein [Drouetiella hepatica Uher 2000/2452]